MDLIFNELSLFHKVENIQIARSIMENLLLCCKRARDSIETVRLRVNTDFFATELTENYSVNSWLNDRSVSQNQKTLLLGLKRSPYIDENDENIEDQYIQSNYSLFAPGTSDFHEKEVEGLAVAFLYNTLAVSLPTNTFWEQPYISLLERHEEHEQTVQVKHFDAPDRLHDHQEWIDLHRPVELLETLYDVSHKEIHLRNDHGKDILLAFSGRLICSPYVEKVINSLPFNSNQKHFIKNIFPDGRIEVVLTWTDKGLGCVVQTTGRNLQETKRIIVDPIFETVC